MNWYDELHEKYKHLFKTYEGEETERSYYKKGQILRGIETDKGWSRAITDFLKTCEWIRTNNNLIPNPNYDETKPYSFETNRKKIETEPCNIKIFQIKEKFGECVCYVTCDGNETQKQQLERAVAKLETKCSLTCQVCGELGYDMIKNVKGWVYCLCDDCLKGNKK